MSADSITIFDTTLRDGEQSPGCSMNTAENLEVAKEGKLLTSELAKVSDRLKQKLKQEWTVKKDGETYLTGSGAHFKQCSDIGKAKSNKDKFKHLKECPD